MASKAAELRKKQARAKAATGRGRLATKTKAGSLRAKKKLPAKPARTRTKKLPTGRSRTGMPKGGLAGKIKLTK